MEIVASNFNPRPKASEGTKAISYQLNNSTEIVNFLRNLRKTWSIRASLNLSKLHFVPWQLIDIRSGNIFLINHPNLKLNHPDRIFIIESLPLIEQLIIGEGMHIMCVETNYLDVEIKGVKIRLETKEDAYILHEVFHCSDYEIKLGKNYHVIDVGANIGIASLYFANRNDVIAVDSFELIPETAKRLKLNLQANPDLETKVTIHEYGLAAESAEHIIEYYPDFKGSMGISGIAENASYLNFNGLKSVRTKVNVKNASQIINNILHANTGIPIVMKIDCEGSEYEIIQDLESSDLLKHIAATVIEWHGRGSDPLRRSLEAASHYVIIKSKAHLHHGIMTSINMKYFAQ